MIDDPSKHTPNLKVTQYLWEYTIPRIHYYSREQLSRKGFAGTYNQEQLRQLMNERLTVSGTLLEIARHHHEDHDPQLVHPEQSVDMYRVICEHLDAASSVIARNSNLGEVPIEDLRALAELSRDLHPLASNFQPDVGEDKRISRFKKLAGRGLRPGMRTPNRNKEAKERPAHDPIIGSIERYIELNDRDRRSSEDQDG